jgi:GR25 family glycosyltransferase involved in LPS biosynthesis
MKHPSLWSAYSRFIFRSILKSKRLLPSKTCQAFGIVDKTMQSSIEHIYVINLSRQPSRLIDIQNEFSKLRDRRGLPIWSFTERYPAVDAKHFLDEPLKNADIDPTYTLREQLFVEPQPLAMPTKLELDSKIQMSRPEIAVAMSHIGVWRKMAESSHEYSLVLEDDVWFRSGFTEILNKAWFEINTDESIKGHFDILYLSYEEVKNGAPKIFISNTLFRPARGLWNLSGYVISRKGAKKSLQLLPCRGPIDLWINHQFEHINVVATRKSIISQRPDLSSTNSYSILPALTKIGAITSETAALFQYRPNIHPVFVFGREDSGLTSIAMALKMLGYRCCRDLQTIPGKEYDKLISGKSDRVFNAYVNIGSLALKAWVLKKNFPKARFILSNNDEDWAILNGLDGLDYAVIKDATTNKWQILCEHLSCAPPACSFPVLNDVGQRKLFETTLIDRNSNCIIPKRDKSPWLIETQPSWSGMYYVPIVNVSTSEVVRLNINDNFEFINANHWLLRDDTFTDNLALFRPKNINLLQGVGVSLTVKSESLGLRDFSAASLTSRNKYLYGKFEAIFKASHTPGVITGFFLHRDSPRQEIDIEIAGHRPDTLIVNVFYNPGGEGAKFDYGYRGAASHIQLGFDASASFHHYAIEWGPTEICWYVDGKLIHRRGDWNPTPIPHLPMLLHANLWPCRSKELAGRLNKHHLPAIAVIKSIAISANQHETQTHHEYTLL